MQGCKEQYVPVLNVPSGWSFFPCILVFTTSKGQATTPAVMEAGSPHQIFIMALGSLPYRFSYQLMMMALRAKSDMLKDMSLYRVASTPWYRPLSPVFRTTSISPCLLT